MLTNNKLHCPFCWSDIVVEKVNTSTTKFLIKSGVKQQVSGSSSMNINIACAYECAHKLPSRLRHVINRVIYKQNTISGD